MLGSDFGSMARVGLPIVAVLFLLIPIGIGIWQSSWLWFFGSLLVWLLILHWLYKMDQHFGWTRECSRRVFSRPDDEN